MTESRTVASQPRGLWSRVAGGRSNPPPGQLWRSQLLQIGAFLALALAWPAGAVAQTAVLYSDGLEDRPEVSVQVRGANQPYTARTIGLTQEKAHSGKTSVKIDVTTMHGFEVQLAPRTTAQPGVEWGSIGGAGSFSLPGLDVPLQRDRGYVLEAWVWVEKAPAGVRIDVATVVDSHYGPVAASLVAGGTTKTGSDLLELEIRVAGKMSADTAAAKQALAEVDVLAAAPESLPQALEKALSGLDAVASANLAGPHHATVLAPLERARAALGRVNAIMNGRMAGTLPPDDPAAKPRTETLRGLSKRFYDAQSRLYGTGPAGLAPEVASLLADVLAFERSARVTLGL